MFLCAAIKALCIILLTQVYAQNEELRTQLTESKRIENVLLEHMNKAENKLSILHEDYHKLKVLFNAEELNTQINILRRKFNDVKSELGSIDVIKVNCIEEVKICYVNVCMLRQLVGIIASHFIFSWVGYIDIV